MPKKLFTYKNFKDMKNVWYTDSLKGWFIVKDKNQYFLRKGSIIDEDTLELGLKRFKVYQRLVDAKVGLENFCKDYIESRKKQEDLFNELHKDKKIAADNKIDFSDLDKEVARLKAKWGIR